MKWKILKFPLPPRNQNELYCVELSYVVLQHRQRDSWKTNQIPVDVHEGIPR